MSTCVCKWFITWTSVLCAVARSSNSRHGTEVSMNLWTEFCGYLPTGDCSTDNRGDTPSSSVSSLSSLAAAAADMTSSCFSDVTSRSASTHVGIPGRSGADSGRKPASGFKKCFHCPHCRYSTDRKNNLKRHLGTMHRDHYGSRVMELDQSTYHVSVQSQCTGITIRFQGDGPGSVQLPR